MFRKILLWPDLTNWSDNIFGKNWRKDYENRYNGATIFDKNLPADGILITHIDESQLGNTDEDHKLVDIEEADGNVTKRLP